MMSDRLARAWRWLRLAAAAILVAIAFWMGTRWTAAPAPAARAGREPRGAEKKKQLWTCAMHPQIRLPKPGKCPICGMTLIPLSGAGGGGAEKPVLAMSPAAAALADIETAPAERKFVAAEVRMVGLVDYDETRLAYITAWAPGRLDKLYVDYIGAAVRRGEHMVYLYSPEIYSAQEELLQAIRGLKELRASKLESVRESAQATIEAARERLRLWGLTRAQIVEIERRGTPSYHVTIYAPMSGVVIHKQGVEGMYVQTGARIYTIADLTQVWVKLDAYESDLAWVRYGEEVEFVAEAYPGERFKGAIAFIDPVLNGRTRTVKVRLNVANPRGRLKPGMFVHAVLRSQLTADGRVLAPRLAGKWICPMHPSVVRDKAGRCDICGMPLARAESLGYVGDAAAARPPLVIPASAPLLTGERSVVYVKVAGSARPKFEGRVVELGPRAGEYYIVKSGLREGERVVVRGNFKIDSALQIQAERSMMSMPTSSVSGGPARVGAATAKASSAFQRQLGAVLDAYYPIWRALAKDDARAAAAAARKMLAAVTRTDMKLLKGEAHMAWMRDARALKKSLTELAAAQNVSRRREAFAIVSEILPAALERFGYKSAKTARVFHCPMAFNNRGANWLQDADVVANPFFGEAMPGCGEKIKTLPAAQ